MAETAIISAEIRDIAGKGAARAERRADRVPAVIYGDKQPPVLIAIENKIALREVNRRGFFTHLYDIDIKGKKHRALARDVQFDPSTTSSPISISCALPPIPVSALLYRCNLSIRISRPV